MDVAPPDPMQMSIDSAPHVTQDTSDLTDMQIDTLQPAPTQENTDVIEAQLENKPPVAEHTDEPAPVKPDDTPPAPEESLEAAPVQAAIIPPVPEETSESVEAEPAIVAPVSQEPPQPFNTAASHDLEDDDDERPSKRARLDMDAPLGNGAPEPTLAAPLHTPAATDIPEPSNTASTEAPLGNGTDETAVTAPLDPPKDEPTETPVEAAKDDVADVPMGNGITEAADAPEPVGASNGVTEAPAATTTDSPAGNGITVNTAPVDLPANTGIVETPSTPAPEVPRSYDSTPMSNEQRKFLLEQVRKSKKVKSSTAYLNPVDPVELGIPTYFDLVKEPMDLSTIENKLKEEKYGSVDEVVRDFYLMVNNSKLFNGPTHVVYLAGENLRKYFLKCLDQLPQKGEKPSEDASKKAKKPPPEKRASLPRRETRPTVTPVTPAAPAPGPAGSPSTTFATLGGVPLIRRDSAADGRPKREIHRPPPKDLPYTNPRPRKKKYQLELKFCEHVLKVLLDKKNYDFVYPFYKPVDPVALNIPNYHNVIKKPMDLETVEKNLKQGQYGSAKDFKEQVDLMLRNCFKFNPDGDFVNQCGKQTEAVLKQVWDEKDEWIREHTPQSEPRSEEEEEEDEEEEEEEDADGEVKADRLDLLQKQIAALHAEMTNLVQGAKRTSPGAKPSKKAKAAKSGGSKKKRSESTAGATSTAAKASKPKKEKKVPKLTQEQKKEVSDGIGLLDDEGMRKAVQIIRNGVPALRNVNDDELELDIDEIPEPVVYELYKFVRSLNKANKSASMGVNVTDAGAYDEPEDDDYAPPSKARGGTAGPGRKKNKPMGAQEQERKIAEIKAQLEGFQQPPQQPGAVTGSGSSARDSDDDDDDESESEEE